MRHSSPSSRAALHAQLRRHPGFSLTEVMMGLGIVSSLGAAAYLYYSHASLAAQVKSEQANVNTVFERADKAYGRVGSFSGMSNTQAIEQGWAPKELVKNGALRSTWDTPVTLQPETVNGRPNVALRMTYADLPSSVCVKLATAIASSMWDVEIDGQTVFGAHQTVDPNAVVSRCNSDEKVDVSFVRYDGALGALAEAAPLILPCPPAQQQALTCPPGEFGYIQQERTAICGPTGDWGGSAADWNAWTTVRDTCDPNIDCVVAGTCPPPLIPAPQACIPPPAQQRNSGCPAGQIGSNMQERTASCPSTTGAYTWSSWADIPGGNSCTPAGACPAPQTRNTSCPTGMIPGSGGGVVEQRDCEGVSGGTPSWSEWYLTSSDCVENSTPVGVACWEEEPPTCPPPSNCNLPTPNPETRDVACEAPLIGPQLQHRQAYCLGTGGGADNWEWSGWYNIGEPDPRCYTCPPDDTETRTVPENRTVTACPAGQYGSTAQTRTHNEERTRNYTCPAAGGPGTPNPWTAWVETSVTAWSPAATCTPCPAPSTAPESQYVAGTCPVGEVGTIEVERSRTNSVSYNCPANTASLPPATVTPGAWSFTGGTRNSTCEPACTVPSPSTVTTLGAWSGWYALYSCEDIHGPGMAGDYYQRSRSSCTRTYSCPAPSGSAVLSPAPGVCTDIYEETNTCAAGPVCPPSAPAVGGPATCPPGQSGTITGWNPVAAPTCYTATTNCAPTPTPSCSNPAPATTPTCPSGGNESGGSWAQAAAPGCTWSYSGGTCPPPAAPSDPPCSAPAPVFEPQTRGAPDQITDLGCPSGWSGSNTQTCPRTESGTKTTTYSCPAPTGAYSTSESTTWSGSYSVSGACATSNTCVAPTAPAVLTDVNGSLLASFRTTDPPSSRRILGYISVGDTAGFTASFANPADWSVTWNIDGVASLSATQSGNGLSIDHVCNGPSTAWAVTATVEHLPTGATSSHDWAVECNNVGL